MTHTINEAMELSDFGVKAQKLIELLSDKKAVDYLAQGVGKAAELKAMKEEAENLQKAADKSLAEAEKKTQIAETRTIETTALNEAAAKALSDAQIAKIDSERELEETRKKSKSLDDAIKKTQVAEQRAIDKTAILEGKISETEDLKSQLKNSISEYNDAVGNLKAAKVA